MQQWRKWRLTTWYKVAWALVLLSLTACGPRLHFSTDACSGADGFGEPETGILTQTWLGENTLAVDAFVKTVCHGAKISGGYQLEGNQLTLTYRVRLGMQVTSCNCQHTIHYVISGLESDNYSISLEGE